MADMPGKSKAWNDAFQQVQHAAADLRAAEEEREIAEMSSQAQSLRDQAAAIRAHLSYERIKKQGR